MLGSALSRATGQRVHSLIRLMSAVNMRFLIVTCAFYPANSPRANRATELAKELSRQGHSVSVLTTRSCEQEALASTYGISFTDLGEPGWPGIPAESSLLLRATRAFLLKFFGYPAIGWTLRVFRRLPAETNYDCAISVAAPHAVHWGVALAATFGKKPAVTWIADCGDPFMGQENSSFFTSPAFYFRWVEKFFCRRVDWITIPTEGAKKGYYQEFQEKLAVIPQGFKFEEYDYLREIEPNSSIPRFAYAGHIIPGKRDPRQLIHYLLGDDRKFEFHIFTKQVDLIEASRCGDPRIVVHEFLPREKVLPILANMHFLINLENVGTRQSPSKLIDYWLCGRPVLSLHSSDLDTHRFDQFLTGNYLSALVIDKPEQYRIESIVSRFVQLTEYAQKATP